MSRVVAVVGGGISGLVAARALAAGAPASRAGAEKETRPRHQASTVAEQEVEVVLLEAADHFGGKIRSGELRGHAVDLGPDNFLTRDPSVADLCRQLGLGDGLEPPETSSASVLARGRLRPLPAGLVLGIPTDLETLARSGIVSAPGLARAALDLVPLGAPIAAASVGIRLDDSGDSADSSGQGAQVHDPRLPEWNAASILERRLGRELVERLVDPLLGGINAGRTDQLSLAVVAPQVARALVGQRSIMHALKPVLAQTRANGAVEPKPLFLGLRGGLGRLIEALVADLGNRSVTVRSGTEVTALRLSGKRCELETATGTVSVDGVVLATPGYVAARLLADSVPPAAAELGSIPHASVALVTFAWERDAIGDLPVGSGFLVPRCEGRLITGCTVMSAKWPATASAGEVVIRASTGRYGDERPSSMSDDELVARVVAELTELIRASAPPLASLVQRWPKAFPQYLPGHIEKIARARSALGGLPPLELAGASLGGIGIPACARSGEQAAMTVLDRLRE